MHRSAQGGQIALALLRMWIQHEEIDVVLLALGLRDVFAMLPHEKFVQFEVFTDNRFTDCAHLTASKRLFD